MRDFFDGLSHFGCTCHVPRNLYSNRSEHNHAIQPGICQALFRCRMSDKFFRIGFSEIRGYLRRTQGSADADLMPGEMREEWAGKIGVKLERLLQ
jgi:hypothetical protein